MNPHMKKICFRLLVFIISPLFISTTAWAEKGTTSTTDKKGSLESDILGSKNSSTNKKTKKAAKHKHRKKVYMDKNSNSQNSSGPQEDVTDQREVSNQADQTTQKKKK